MKHLQIFNSMEEFEVAKPSMDTPYVVLEKGTPKVIYSNLSKINEDDLTVGDWIDLDLPSGIKWASCNLGAEKPCDPGNYYQWAGLIPCTTSSDFSWESCVYHEGSDYFSNWLKYVTNSYNGVVDNKNILDNEDDIVYLTTAGTAHIPSALNTEELYNNTTHSWCKCLMLGEDHLEHDIYGILFTSKVDESKKIFIPAAGYITNYGLLNFNLRVMLWINEVSKSSPHYAYSFDGLDNIIKPNYLNYYRKDALNVRGVRE